METQEKMGGGEVGKHVRCRPFGFLGQIIPGEKTMKNKETLLNVWSEGRVKRSVCKTTQQAEQHSRTTTQQNNNNTAEQHKSPIYRAPFNRI